MIKFVLDVGDKNVSSWKNLTDSWGDENVTPWEIVAEWQVIGPSPHECTWLLEGDWSASFQEQAPEIFPLVNNECI